jgi:dipeptide transport system permease protein
VTVLGLDARWLPALLRRLGLALLTFVGISLLAFVLVHLFPGDPVQMMAGVRRLDPAFHAEMLHRLGLDRPLPEQYLRYVWNALQFDLGRSVVTQIGVWDEFLRLFPATLELSLGALLIALPLGVLAGVAAAIQRGGWTDRFVTGAATLGASMPVFWWGLLLITVFSVGLHEWAPALALPVAGRIGLDFDVPVRSGLMLIDSLWSDEPGAWRSALAHLALPATVLATAPLALIARMTRAAMLDVLGDDYVRTARAKGLRERRVVGLHALRNALLPLLTVAGMLIGTLLGGAVFTETLFSWPGVGKWLVDAVGRRDYPVLQGGILITATLMVCVNLAIDGLYALADPRLRR